MDELLKAQIEKIDQRGIVPFPEELRSKVRDGTIPECRIIFLGDGGNGKSSLIERILKDTVGADKTPTTGIDTSWGLTTARRISDPEKAVCCLRFMDFGGQAIQANIHRCFMTAHTIYVLVCDLDKARNSTSSNDALDQISRWLYETSRYSPKSPVLVALNKSDLVEELETPRVPAAQRKAGAINGAVHDVLITSAVKENRGKAVGGLIEAIRTEIKGCRKAMEERERWHKNWIAVRRELEETNQDYISHAEFQAICRRHMVFPFRQKKLLTWLQNQGAFYACFRDEMENRLLTEREEAGSSDLLALLHPLWMAKRIYHVILYIPPEQDSQPDTRRQYLLRHEDVIRILRGLDKLKPEELASITPMEFSERLLDTEQAVEATEKERQEKDYLLAVMRRLSLSLMWGHNEEAFPSRMTEMKDSQREIRSELRQRWIVNSISKSGETYTPPFHVSILQCLMCSKAEILTRPDKNYANYAQFVKGEHRLDIVLNQSQLDLCLWGEAGTDGKRFLKEFRDLVRDYLKENHISATEYAFDGDTPYTVAYLKEHARVALNAENPLTGRDILRRYDLPMGFPSLIKTARCQSVSGLQRATRLLALSTAVMVVIILIISVVMRLSRTTDSPADDAVSITDTVSEGADAFTSDKETHTDAAEDTAEDEERRANARLSDANARLTDTKRTLLILGVSAGTFVLIALFFVLLYFKIRRRDEERKALMDTLMDIRNLIGASQK